MQKLPTGAGAAGELLYEGIQLGRDATYFLGSPMGDALLVWSVLWYPFFGALFTGASFPVWKDVT